MQSFTKIIGMPVISIFNCENIGTVLNMQISKDKSKIKFLVISSNDDETTYLLPTKSVYSLNSAVLIRNKQTLSVTSELGIQNLINLNAFGLSGKSFGKIKDIELDDKWRITSIIADEPLSSKTLLDYTNNIALFNDIEKKLTKGKFAPRIVEPQNAPQVASEQIVTTLSQESGSSIYTPRTITARLPKNFRNP